jgi:hypothetical protein
MLCNAILPLIRVLSALLWTKPMLVVFLSRRRKTHSLLFVHIEAPFVYNKISFETKPLRVFEMFSR